MRTLLTKALCILFVLLLLIESISVAQQNLDEYIQFGLANNQVLQQKNTSLEKALLSLKIAQGMFAPTVAVQGSFTNGEGGRAINFPVGDLLNPVYQAIGSAVRVENQNINFFPQNFYDARVRTAVPIVNSDLVYNKRIQHQQQLLQEYEVVIYKRELIRNIKVAYFNYLSAREAQQIYANAMTRAHESKRINESLLANGKGLPAYVIRSQSEIENVKSQITEAEQQVKNAQLYFNFLLNRPAETEIVNNFKSDDELSKIPFVLAQQVTVLQREELVQLQTAMALSTSFLNMKQAFWIPRVGGFIDLGAQAENMKYSRDANYFLVGIQLDMPLFAGFTNRYKIQQAKLDFKNAELNQDYVSNQLAVSSSLSRNALVSAYQNYKSALKQVEAALSYNKLIDKGYKEGVNTFIESIDARNMLTNAQLLLTINQFKVLTAEANLERETASYTFK